MSQNKNDSYAGSVQEPVREDEDIAISRLIDKHIGSPSRALRFECESMLREAMARLAPAQADDRHRVSHDEWLKKTEFIQEWITANKLPVKYLGWHRADVMRDLIEKAEQPAASVEPVIRYDGVYEYASANRLNYGQLCKLVREAVITAQPAKDEREAVYQIKLAGDSEATWRDATLRAYELAPTNKRRILNRAALSSQTSIKDAERLAFLAENMAWIQWSRRDGSIRQCQVFMQDDDENHHVLSGEHRYFITPSDAIDAAIKLAAGGKQS